MSIRSGRALGIVFLIFLGLTTHLITSRLIESQARAKASRPAALIGYTQPSARNSGAKAPTQNPSLAPHTSYRQISKISDGGIAGGISLIVDVECWDGEEVFRHPSSRQIGGYRLRVCVYPPDDPRRQAEPLHVWLSPAVPARPNALYQERVPVNIPVPAHPMPYHVTTEIISALPVHHVPLASAESRFVPKAHCGDSFQYLVH